MKRILNRLQSPISKNFKTNIKKKQRSPLATVTCKVDNLYKLVRLDLTYAAIVFVLLSKNWTIFLIRFNFQLFWISNNECI